MKKSDEIKINKRSTDKVYFESTLIQNISDTIDFITDESKELMKQIDTPELDNIGEDIHYQISNVVDELSQLKSEIIDEDNLPQEINESSNNIKRALNRDEDYVRRAKRRLKRLDSNEYIDVYKTNLRVIELCDKAIKVNNSNYEAYYTKGLALINLEKYDLAIEEFINCLVLKDNIDAWLKIALANKLNSDFKDAISIYDSVLEKDHESFNAFKGKAYCYYELGEYAKASEFFKKANSIQFLDDDSKKIWNECLDEL